MCLQRGKQRIVFLGCPDTDTNTVFEVTAEMPQQHAVSGATAHYGARIVEPGQQEIRVRRPHFFDERESDQRFGEPLPFLHDFDDRRLRGRQLLGVERVLLFVSGCGHDEASRPDQRVDGARHAAGIGMGVLHGPAEGRAQLRGSVPGGKPEARLMADTLATVYIEHNTEQARMETREARRFIDEQLQVSETRSEGSSRRRSTRPRR